MGMRIDSANQQNPYMSEYTSTSKGIKQINSVFLDKRGEVPEYGTEGDEAENVTDKTPDKFKTGNSLITSNPEYPQVTYFEYDDSSGIGLMEPKTIDDIPKGSHNNVRDARYCDISGLNLTKEQLLDLVIDKTTVMSDEQRAIIEEYSEKMKNPGLGIRELHEQGYTGEGVKMAIIDGALGDHEEYRSNVKELHDVNCAELGSHSAKACNHGSAVTSIAAGKTTGVAPDAEVIYYSAVQLSKDPEDIELYKANILKELQGNSDNEDFVEYYLNRLKDIDSDDGIPSNKPYVEAINKILDANENLPESERVSVVSVSWGFDPLAPGYEELLQAIDRAKEQGVFIVSTALEDHYGMDTTGANRNPQGDVEKAETYEAGAFWKDRGPWSEDPDNLLLVPMGHRTFADYQDSTSYIYDGNEDGMSWSTPWLAGMYVLAKQANPDITPEKFWEAALETADKCTNNDSGEYVGKIINPQKLIENIKQ